MPDLQTGHDSGNEWVYSPAANVALEDVEVDDERRSRDLLQRHADLRRYIEAYVSGLPVIHGRDDLEYINCSDEHGVISDPNGVLKLNDKLMLVPGHCDPTCNLHDWYVGLRNGKVECLWPITARGMSL